MYENKKRSIWKRIWAMVLVVIMAMSLTACGGGEPFTCDICGQEKTGKSYKTELFGQKVTICKDCNESLNTLGELFK